MHTGVFIVLFLAVLAGLAYRFVAGVGRSAIRVFTREVATLLSERAVASCSAAKMSRGTPHMDEGEFCKYARGEADDVIPAPKNAPAKTSTA